MALSANSISTGTVRRLNAEVRHDILSADARQLSGTLTRDLIFPLIALNRGGIDGLRRCPRLIFDVSQPEDLTAYADALPKLSGLFSIPAPWVREKLHIPEPSEGEEILGIKMSNPPAPENVVPVTKQTTLSATIDSKQQKSSRDTIAPLADQLQSAATGAWSDVLAHVEAMVNKADSLESLQAQLLTAYDGLPLDKLRAVMSAGFSVARLAGMADVIDETADKR